VIRETELEGLSAAIRNRLPESAEPVPENTRFRALDSKSDRDFCPNDGGAATAF